MSTPCSAESVACSEASLATSAGIWCIGSSDAVEGFVTSASIAEDASPSSQGQTSGRVLVHVESSRASEKLVNQRLAYVAVSRGQYDARIYTDDKAKLARALDRDVSHRSALERTPAQASRQTESREIARSESIGHTMAAGSS